MAKHNPKFLAKLIEFALEKKKFHKFPNFFGRKIAKFRQKQITVFKFNFWFIGYTPLFTSSPTFSLIKILIIIIINILLFHLTAVDIDPTATSALRLGFAGESDEVAKPRNGERKQKQQNEEETRKEIEENSRKKTERGER